MFASRGPAGQAIPLPRRRAGVACAGRPGDYVRNRGFGAILQLSRASGVGLRGAQDGGQDRRDREGTALR